MSDLLGLTKREFALRWNSMSAVERQDAMAAIEVVERAGQDPTPATLAKRLDPSTIQTPALTLIDAQLVKVAEGIENMYRRRVLLTELTDSGIPVETATEMVREEIPDVGVLRLIINMPPQEGKSQRVSRYGLLWLLRRFPTLRAGLVSYDGANATTFSYQVRADIELFNGRDEPFDLGLRLAPDQKAKSRFLLTRGGGVYAIGIGGGLTGRPLDLGLIDDPTKDYRDAESSLKSDNSWVWWQTTMKPRLAPWCPVIVVSTRWHEYDLTGRLALKQLEDEAAGVHNYDKWTVLNIPAEAEGDDDPLGREPGEFLASARGRTTADWQALKQGMEPRFWTSLYQGRPAPETGDIFLKEWWRTYDEVMWVKKLDGTFRVPGWELSQSWDFAFRDTKHSDYVVGQLWAKKGAESRLITQTRARLSFTATCDAIRRLSHLFPEARRKIVEAKANGDAIIDALHKEIPGIIAVTPDQSKEARARAVTMFVRAGNLALPSPRVAMADPEIAFSPLDFIAEHTSFPNGANDDQVDCTTQYLKVMYLEGGEGTFESPVGIVLQGNLARSRPTKGVPLTPIQMRLEQKRKAGVL